MLSPERKSVLLQIVRFGIVGGIATLCQAMVYSPLAAYKVTSPQVANALGYIAAMVAGYFLHSKWSFRDQGRRDNPGRTSLRFFVVSLISYGLNALWVFLLTDSQILGGPWWWPLIPFLFVTPAVTFTLNRQWVFR